MNRLALLSSVLVLAGCAATAAPQSPPAPEPQRAPARPLSPLTAQPILVLPVHYVHPTDSLGWAVMIPDERAFRQRVDAEIAFALRERGVADRWILPEAIIRSVKRNPGFAPDPRALAAEQLLPGVVLADRRLAEPLASQVRALVALGDARYVLFPVEVRFHTGADGGRAALRVVLLDARASQLNGVWDVLSDSTSAFSPAIATSLAEHLADLIAAP